MYVPADQSASPGKAGRNKRRSAQSESTQEEGAVMANKKKEQAVENNEMRPRPGGKVPESVLRVRGQANIGANPIYNQPDNAPWLVQDRAEPMMEPLDTRLFLTILPGLYFAGGRSSTLEYTGGYSRKK